jgi:hypothetical protein
LRNVQAAIGFRWMKNIGECGMVVGLLGAFHTTGDSITAPGSDTFNIGLIANRHDAILFWVGAGIIGAILYAAGCLGLAMTEPS